MSIHVDSVHPVNREYGAEAGTPIARYYIDKYMERMASTIRGKVLEFGSPTYAAGLQCDYEIIDIAPDNPRATLRVDVCDETFVALRPEYYDVVLCTAVLQLVSDPQKAVDNMQRALKSGGVLIVAEKSVSKIDSWFARADRWRFSPHGLEWLLRRYSEVRVQSYGNVYVLCAYLLGMPAETVEADKLDYADPEHPLVAIACART
jgi:SAM-dependent methyltransferase